MGNNGNRVIEVERLEDQISMCQLIENKSNSLIIKVCPVYGQIHLVEYQGMQFYFAQSQANQVPHPSSLHYYVPPTTLIISEFQLLEDLCPSTHDSLLQIIMGVAEMASSGPTIGIGYNRIGYAGRWGVVGEQSPDWAYQQVLDGECYDGAYLSPQLMISLSQGKRVAKHDEEKSDVYALGIMMVEIIFQEKLNDIFDYDNYEIRLNSLLEKLLAIRNDAGDDIYELFIGMLETDEADRFTFQEIFQFINTIRKNRSKMINSRMNSSTHSRDTYRTNHTPNRARPDANGGSRTPRRNKENPFRNDVSPFRGRFAPNARVPERLGRTPDRSRVREQQSSRSPLRRDLKINSQYGRDNQYGQYNNETGRRPLSPISRR